jgi:hypothetical protein
MKRIINLFLSALHGGWTHGYTQCQHCYHISYTVYHTSSVWLECSECRHMARYAEVYHRAVQR